MARPPAIRSALPPAAASWRRLPAVALLLGLAACSRPALEPLDIVELQQGWLYRWGDSPTDSSARPLWSLAAADPAGWSAVVPPRLPSDKPSAERYVWMRLTLPQELPEAAAVYLRWVDQNVEAYVDGRLAYRWGEPGFARLVRGSPFHLIPLRPEDGGRLLTLRIYSEHLSAGVNGVPLLGPRDALVRFIARDGAPEFGLGVAMLMISVVALAFLALERSRRIVYLALFSLACGLYTLTGVTSPLKNLLSDRSALIFEIEYFSLYLVPAFYFGFYESIALPWQKRPVRWLSRGFLAYAAAAFLLDRLGLLPLSDTLLPYHLSVAVAMLAGLGMAALATREKRGGATVFLAGLAATTLGGLHDLLAGQKVLPTERTLVYWGFFVFILCIGTHLLREFAAVLRERQAYSSELGRRNLALTEARARFEEAAVQLDERAQAISAASTQQAQMASRLAAGNQQTSATAAEIAVTTRLTSSAAEKMITTASRSAELSREGQRAVSHAVAAMEALGEGVEAIAGSVAGLSKNTAEIGEIITTVHGIAEQSNLLALNAAIEASRAGEHGRGFGVVASEMRGLAEGSKSAALRVRALLLELHKGTRSTVETTERGSEGAAQAVMLAREAGEAISQLAEVIEDFSRVAQQIARSAGEQTTGVESIAEAITDSAKALAESADGVQSIEKAAADLSGLSRRLAELARATTA